jgi:hypothetical protein
LNPASPDIYLGLFTVVFMVLMPFVIHETKYSQYALPVKEATSGL